jgi:two-component system, response regulator
MRAPKSITIVLAEDDPDDRLLAEEALEEAGISNPVVWVKDGVDLMDWLKDHEDTSAIVLLDLNMPRMNGHEALESIREKYQGSVVVVVLTTSAQEEDIMRSYNKGVNSYLRKPLRAEDFAVLARSFGDYWLKHNQHPVR